jgi:hypothetical protein
MLHHWLRSTVSKAKAIDAEHSDRLLSRSLNKRKRIDSTKKQNAATHHPALSECRFDLLAS